jgi:transposase
MIYSKERRAEVLAACDAGEGTKAVALRFHVSESWVRRVKQDRRELGKVAPATTRRRNPTWLPQAERIREMVRSHNDLTLDELSAKLDYTVGRVTLCRALQALRLTLKKKSGKRPSKSGRTSR